MIVWLALLTSATTAYAECAWILWAGGVKTSGEAVYAPIEGYPTRAECMKGRTASSVEEVEQLKRDVAGAGMKLAFTCAFVNVACPVLAVTGVGATTGHQS